MKKIFKSTIFIAFVLSAQIGHAQTNTAIVSAAAEQNQSVFGKKQKFDHEGIELYDSNVEMKSYKRFGLGLMAGGSTGVLSVNGEINLDLNEALTIGLGMGPGYGSFGVNWKHNFEAMYLSPYTKLGYAKWYSSSRGSNSATDSEVLKRVYSENDLRNNRFDVDFIVGSAGLEYNQLEGELSGINLFGEVVMMTELRKVSLIPTGAIGITYYY